MQRVWHKGLDCQLNVQYHSNMTNIPSTRSEARMAGAKHYWTGLPCSKGHITFRHITGTCIDCAKMAVKRWAERNPEEGKRRAAAWQHNNRERARIRFRNWRRKKEGIPDAPYPAPDNCENCARVFKSGHDCHLDHDHKTGKFRGWLCNRCNRGLGYFGDTLEGMKQGVSYLERAEERNK